jgi:hypothetical protein
MIASMMRVLREGVSVPFFFFSKINARVRAHTKSQTAKLQTGKKVREARAKKTLLHFSRSGSK